MRSVRTAAAALAPTRFARPRIACVYVWNRVACALRWVAGMSQKCVEVLIGRLATDETLRARFLADPVGTLRSLRENGFDLNLSEIEALIEMPTESWTVMAAWIHPRLQKIALKGDRSEP